jgi:peptidoglycan/xylan/chitin deacetylase (PgdA/CDA1 family)
MAPIEPSACPDAGNVLFTSSWDDGHPLDLRLAELLQRHGFPGTFYVPIRNGFGLPVISAPEIRRLAAVAEVGSHTLDHCYLTSVGDTKARAQICAGKSELEQALGATVAGFCYPGGQFNAAHRRMVAAAGFRYARTTVNLCSDGGTDPFLVPTSLQLYPHPRSVYLRNWMRRGRWLTRHDLARVALSNAELLPRLRAALARVARTGGLFHLWGHSWEFDAIDGWRVLDEFLRYASDLVPADLRLTNHAALLRVGVPAWERP